MTRTVITAVNITLDISFLYSCICRQLSIDEFNFTTPIPRICPHCIFCCSYDDFINATTAEAGNIIRNLTLDGRISKFCNMR